MSQTWQERRLCHKRGKRDNYVAYVARETTTWQERRQHGKRDVNVAIATLSGNMEKKKIPLFFNSMANFVHNAANRTSKFLQYVLIKLSICFSKCKEKNKHC
jgi:hypothetical protein